MIYKNHNLSIPKIHTETDFEHQCRLWFVTKNIHLIDKCIKNEEILDLQALLGYSNIHLKINQYNHTYPIVIMEVYEILLKNLYI